MNIVVYKPSGMKIELPNVSGKRYDIDGVVLSIDECVTPPTEDIQSNFSLTCLQERLRRTIDPVGRSSSPEVKELPLTVKAVQSEVLSLSSPSSSPEVKELPLTVKAVQSEVLSLSSPSSSPEVKELPLTVKAVQYEVLSLSSPSSSPEVKELPLTVKAVQYKVLPLSSPSSSLKKGKPAITPTLSEESNGMSAVFCQTTHSSVDLVSPVNHDVSIMTRRSVSQRNTRSTSNQLAGNKRTGVQSNTVKKKCKTYTDLTSMFETLGTIPLVSN